MEINKKLLRRIKREILKKCDIEDVCHCCHTKKPSFQMTFHHRAYIQNDVVYKNYPNNIKGRQNYYTDLVQVVEKDPARFCYVCIPCHEKIEYWIEFGPNIEACIRAVFIKKGVRSLTDVSAARIALHDIILRETLLHGRQLDGKQELRAKLFHDLRKINFKNPNYYRY